MSSTSENNKMVGAASFPIGESSSEGVVIVVMVGVTDLTYRALCSLGANTNLNVLEQGVSGSGKTTLGAALAKALSLPFIDADDLHSEGNKAKMTRGEPLTDADRAPWLVSVRRAAMEAVECNRRGVVVACSALKASYRQVLRGERTNLYPDGYPRGDACGEGIVTARDDRGQPVEEGMGGMEGRLGREKGRTGGVSTARLTRQSAPPARTVFVHPFGARAELMERMKSREAHFMKADMLESQIEILENPAELGEIGIVEVRLEARAEEQVWAAAKGVSELLPDM
jgi:gluconokinase